MGNEIPFLMNWWKMKKLQTPIFCWICGRKLYGGKAYYILGESGYVKWVHKCCAKEYNYPLIKEKYAKALRLKELNLFN